MRKALVLMLVLLPAMVAASSSSGSGGGSYAETVLADAPAGYWRLGEEPAATAAADTSGRGHAGVCGSRVSQGMPGALVDPNTAVALPGPVVDDALSDIVVSDAPGLDFATGDFSVELWLRTDVATPPVARFANGV